MRGHSVAHIRYRLPFCTGPILPMIVRTPFLLWNSSNCFLWLGTTSLVSDFAVFRDLALLADARDPPEPARRGLEGKGFGRNW